MFLYLVQHAEAKREDEDPTRDLTDRGRRDIVKLAAYVGRLNLAVSRILHSGKTRALRTGEILSEFLKPARDLAATDGLAPLDDPEIWAHRVATLTEDVVLVGHLPHLARLAALLVCGDEEKTVVDFRMGGMVCLRRQEEGRWAVAWMLIPDVIP